MKIKFIHTGDIHLGCKFNKASFPREIAKSRREEMWSTFHNIIALAKKEEIHFLFISGDMFEDNLISIGDLKRINDGFQLIPSTHVVITPGNHDTYSEKTPYKFIEWANNVDIFQNQEFTKFEYPEKNTIVHGFAWKEKYIKEEFLFDMDSLDPMKTNILMIHGDIYNKVSHYLPIEYTYLNKLPFDYVALGHIHKPDILANHIRYCGSPEPLDFGEVGARGIILGEIVDHTLQAKFHPMSNREFIVEELHLNPEMTFQDIVNLLKSYPTKEKDLFRFHLLGFIDADIQIEEALNEGCRDFYYVEINNQIYPDYNLDKIMIENTDNIIGTFIREMKKKDLGDGEVKNALYLGLQALLKEKIT